LIEIPFRDENGALKSTSQLDEEVFAAVLKLKKKEDRLYCILWISQMGYQSPSDDLIKN
jgi:hypothetical protein